MPGGRSAGTGPFSLNIRFAKEQDMLTTLAYSASLPAIALGLMYYISACTGLVY
jgi:hypothetical protein